MEDDPFLIVSRPTTFAKTDTGNNTGMPQHLAWETKNVRGDQQLDVNATSVPPIPAPSSLLIP